MSEADVSNAQLVAKIKEILEGADLSELSAKRVRQQLEAHFSVNLQERKKDVDKMILECTEGEETRRAEAAKKEKKAKSEPKPEKSSPVKPARAPTPPPKTMEDRDHELALALMEEDGGRRPRRAAAPVPKATKRQKKNDGTPKKKRPARICQLSPELADFVGTDRMGRGDVTKALWAYIREHNLKDPNDGRQILCDDRLFAILKRKKVTMFSMNKFLSPHIKDLGALVDAPKDAQGGAAVGSKRRAEDDAEDEEEDDNGEEEGFGDEEGAGAADEPAD